LATDLAEAIREATERTRFPATISQAFSGRREMA
jgi:hypothetical protein